MIGWVSLAILLAGVVGLAVKLVLKKFGWGRHVSKGGWYFSREFRAYEISWKEFAAVLVLLTFIIAPVGSYAGTKLSIGEQLQYVQFLNGADTAANDNVITCYAGHEDLSTDTAGGSNCSWTYVSGYYTYEWTTTHQDCTTDSKGNQTCTTVIDYHSKRVDIYTPYATQEHTYSIDSSMGKVGKKHYDFPGAYLDVNPIPYPASTRAIPNNAPRGAPALWNEVKARLQANDPRAVEMLGTYKNYIYAAKDPLYEAYSNRMGGYLKDGLLPDHTADINGSPLKGEDASQADKVSFVGVDVPDKGAWQSSVMRFNTALGMQLQGDLHVVLVDAATVPWTDAEPYTQALKAYWQSDTFGRRAIAKNAIILVMGVDKATNKVAWADASTGMPFGNELMIQFLRDKLPGTDVDPTALFGTPRTIIHPDDSAEVQHVAPEGVAETIMFTTATFKRFSMSCDGDDCIGFTSLITKIKPTLGAKLWVFAGTIVLALIFWAVTALTDFVDRALANTGRWLRRHVLPQKRLK